MIIPLYPEQGDGSNATSIQGDAVSPLQPTNGQVLVYDLATQQYIPRARDINDTTGTLAADRMSLATASTAGVVPGIGGTPAGNAATVGQAQDWAGFRESAGYLWSDGVTANRAQIQTPGPRGNLAGAPLASWVGWVRVPASNPAATSYIAFVSGGAVALGEPNSLGFSLDTAGLLSIRQNGASGLDTRRRNYAAFRATYSGQRIWLEVRFTNGTSNPVIRINGTDVSGLFADLNANTIPDWLNASLSSVSHATGHSWPAGPAPLGCWLNTHLTDAESEAWRITGRPPAWVSYGGGLWSHDFLNAELPQVSAGPREAIVPMTLQTGSGFTQDIYNLTTNPDGVAALPSGAVRAIKFTTSNNNGYNFVTARRPGQRTAFSFWYYVPTGQPDVQVLANGILAGNNLVLTGLGSVKDTWTQLTVSLTQPSPVGSILFRTASAGTAYVADVRGQTEGALSLPVVHPIAALGDGTTLGDNPARLVGIQPVTTRKDWQITARTATSGNEQLLGGSFLDPSRDVFDSIEQTPESGTPTTTVGSASGGAQYKTSGVITAGINAPNLVTRKVATANVWVGSSTADPVRTTLTGHSR